MIYVDIPDPESIGDKDRGAWIDVHSAKTKAEAVAWIRENIGPCDDDGNVCLLSEVEGDE